MPGTGLVTYLTFSSGRLLVLLCPEGKMVARISGRQGNHLAVGQEG